MKWFQAHFRVMSRLFELGLFDEVNACYRRLSISDSEEDQAHFIELVLNNEIEEYRDFCLVFLTSYKVDCYSNHGLLLYYYNAKAILTLYQVITASLKDPFITVDAATTMYEDFYTELFEPSGKIKDDVLIAAFNNEVFRGHPGEFLHVFLDSLPSLYYFDNDFQIQHIKKYCFYGSISRPTISSQAISEFDLSNFKFSEEAKADKFENAQGYCIEEPTDSQKINYFQIDSRLDYGFGLLKLIDLLGMNLLLVAQRRQYLFKCLRNDDLRSNFEALEQVKSEDIVLLHNNAVSACSAYEKALKSLFSNQMSDHEVNVAVNAYIGRYEALYHYLRYFYELLGTLNPLTLGTNKFASWRVNFYFFDIHKYFVDLSETYDSLLKKIVEFLGSEDVVESFKKSLSSDQWKLNHMVKTLPQSLYKTCAHFAPFNNEEQIHPRVVDFEEVVNSVLSYRNRLNETTICLPSPIHELSPFALEDNGIVDSQEFNDIAFLLQMNNDHYEITIHQLRKLCFVKSVIRTCDSIEFNRKLNVYLDMFSFASLLVEAFNHTYLMAIFNAKASEEDELEFDLTYSDIKWVECVFPYYQMLLQDEIFGEFLVTHKDCFKELALILDLQGQSNLLYSDSYMSTLLHITDTYDEELAQSLSKKLNTKQELTLTKAEQLILNKTCISLIQGCQKILCLGKELLTRKMDFFEGFDGIIGSRILEKAKELHSILTLCSTPIHVFSHYIVQSLDNVPADLMPNADLAPEDYQVNEVNQKFYKDLYESFMVVLANDVNEYARSIVPYAKLASKEEFAQALSSITLIEPSLFHQEHYSSVMLAYSRFSKDKHDQAMNKQICKNTFFANSALYLLLCSNFNCVNWLMATMVKLFVNHLWQIKRVKQVTEFIDYYNAVYNVVSKLKGIVKNHDAKLDNLKNLAYQDNVVLSESFEYKSYLSEVVYSLSLLSHLCKQYVDIEPALESVNRNGEIENFLALYTDLLEEPHKVLMQINGKYLHDIFMKESTIYPYLINEQYHTVNNEYTKNFAYYLYGVRYYALEPLVGQLFGEDINVCLSSADRDLACYVHLKWENISSRGKLTKVTCKMVELVKEKLHLMSDSEINKLLNIDSKLISTQIVDSSASNAATNHKLHL